MNMSEGELKKRLLPIAVQADAGASEYWGVDPQFREQTKLDEILNDAIKEFPDCTTEKGTLAWFKKWFGGE